MLDLTGKVAVITGAGMGIGAEISRLFAQQGAAVVLVARRVSVLRELEESLNRLGQKALAVPGDVTDPNCAPYVFKTAIETFGRIDILVNNAGITDHHYAATRTSDKLWNDVLAVNETAPFRFAREALKYMTQRGQGSIINISSIGGVYSIAGAAYSASKMALLGLTKNIGIQYAGTGIRCNAVCPGATVTGMLEDSGPCDVEMREITERRFDSEAGFSEPADIAHAALFFAADESRYVNGQYLVVDRGSCI